MTELPKLVSYPHLVPASKWSDNGPKMSSSSPWASPPPGMTALEAFTQSPFLNDRPASAYMSALSDSLDTNPTGTREQRTVSMQQSRTTIQPKSLHLAPVFSQSAPVLPTGLPMLGNTSTSAKQVARTADRERIASRLRPSLHGSSETLNPLKRGNLSGNQGRPKALGRPKTPTWDGDDDKGHGDGMPAAPVREPNSEPKAGESWLNIKKKAVASIMAIRVLHDDTHHPSSRARRPPVTRKELLKLRASAPTWWKMPQTSMKAADRFDTKHRTNCAKADSVCNKLSKVTTDADALEFDEALFAVRLERYFEPKALDLQQIVRVAKPRRAKAVEPFDPYKSVWAPRCKQADSQDLYDTDEVEFRRFSNDWEVLLRLGIIKLILKHDDGDDDGIEDEDGDGIPDEVEDVAMVLWNCHDLLQSIFTFYAMQGSNFDSGDVSGNVQISMTDWLDFANDFKLISKKSKFCKLEDAQLIFVEVNAKSKHGDAGEMDRNQRSLSRIEFYSALIHLGIRKYVMDGTIPDVSDAVERLVVTDILDAATASGSASGLFIDANDFRKRIAYTKEVHQVLVARETTLKNIFGALCERGHTAKRAPMGRLALEDWLDFLNRVELIDFDLTSRDAALSFLWARMVVANYQTVEGRRREFTLTFEDFMEAMCRMSSLKALPTADELKAAGCTHAGQWVDEMRKQPLFYQDRMETLATPWGTEPDKPVGDSVRMVLDIMCHAITKGDPQARFGDQVSSAQVANFVTGKLAPPVQKNHGRRKRIS